MKAATSASIPLLSLPRPAVEILGRFGPGVREISLQDAVDAAGRPRSTVARWLGELVDHRVILRTKRDEYAIPSAPALALILSEPSEYARSLVADHDVLSALRMPHAFACLPIRKALPFSLMEAAPVLNLEDRRVVDLDLGDFPNAFRAHYSAREKRSDELLFPTSASREPEAIPRKFPALRPELALSLFAASADPRVVNAALAACVKMGIDPNIVKERASSFVVESPPFKGRPYANTIVLPRWLSRFHASATGALGRAYLERDAQPPQDVAGEDE